MNDLLVLVIVVAVVANIALMAGAVVYARARRTPDEARPGLAVAAATPGPDLPTPPATAAAPPSAPSEPTLVGPAATEGVTDDVAEPTAEERAVGHPDDDLSTFLDPLTGMVTAAGWDHVVVLEERRHGRYGRPATVVVLELDRIGALAERLGAETADRLIPAVAEAIRRSSRTADVVARTDHATFRILMPETDEIRAINLVERLRETCDTWLEASAVAVRLAIGWASSGPSADLRTAQRIATERMYADRSRGRPAPGRP
jgi:diguanylate cyclase (GGDEF)-like protein